jgi:hypothetical protein
MKSSRQTLLLASLLCVVAAANAENKEYYKLTEAEARAYVEQVKKGEHHDVRKLHEVVSSKETAISLAVAVWSSIFGKEKIEKEAPYQALRIDDCWVVTGSLEKGWLGGTAEAVINAADGSFLNISHGK